MLPTKQIRTNQKNHRLCFQQLHKHVHIRELRNGRISSLDSPEGHQPSKILTAEEIQQRQLIEQYIFSKLEAYANKSRLWQITHSSHIKRHLLKKSDHISDLYSVPHDFVRECINQLFINVDKHVSQARKLIQSALSLSTKPDSLFQKAKKVDNHWRSLQLQRLEQIFPDLDREDFIEDELLQKYYSHIIEILTPTPDLTNTNCVAQCREQPFDLNHAYNQSEETGKSYLKDLLQSYHQRSIPDLQLIEEMVNHGLKDMKILPTCEDFENATNFLSKIFVLRQSKQAYQTGLRNMGDDFMLLRFGKIFGPRALPTTARVNNQFVYLVHLFVRSISKLVILMQTSADQTDEISSTILTLISNLSYTETDPPVLKLNDEDIFSPKCHVDQWTWLLEKWRDALRTFPMMLTTAGAFSRLLRTTIGIGIARIFHFAEIMINTGQIFDLTLMNEQLFHALQIGFYFGIAYAIVDCAQDEIRNVNQIPLQNLAALNRQKNPTEELLSPVEMVDKCLLTMEKLLSGEEYNRKELPKTPLTPLLLETFDSLVILTKSINVTCMAFNELALLLRSQRVDKKRPDEFYNDEELFLGAMLKSHFTYTCTTYLGNIKSAREESERLWIMPFLGQLTDDCRDFYDDITSNSVTSFTHYASFIGRHPSTNKQLLNPFYAFLYLCTDLYLASDRNIQTGAFLGRRIARTLRSIELSTGESALREFLHIFCRDNSSLHDYCSINLRSQFSNVSDPEKSFFRAINKGSILYARTNRKLETYICDHLPEIENALVIHSFTKISATPTISNRDEQLLLSAMNYSVKAGGKRLRPLMMLMVSDLYKMDLKNILPLACGIEYLHTSSLILDDLPAQDNSDLRRGRPTLHKAVINNDIPDELCEGRAQLAAVDLIAVSMSLINHDLVKNGFSSDRVNQVVSEISLSMHGLCIGQMMDLRAAHVGSERGSGQLDELDRIAWLKTGKAIEIVLVGPAILSPLARGDILAEELARIRELARLIGILFQMRDDLLDVEGENMGKPAALDVKNNTVTYVSTLGVEGTRRRLKEFRRETLKLVDQCWSNGAGTIKDVVHFIVDRKN